MRTTLRQQFLYADEFVALPKPVHIAVEEGHWLEGGQFFCRQQQASIADLLAYEEVLTVAPGYANLVDLSPFPAVRGWMERMAQLPYHDEAHVAPKALGDLSAPNELQMNKRLGAATKAGLEAIKAANKAHVPDAKL